MPAPIPFMPVQSNVPGIEEESPWERMQRGGFEGKKEFLRELRPEREKAKEEKQRLHDKIEYEGEYIADDQHEAISQRISEIDKQYGLGPWEKVKQYVQTKAFEEIPYAKKIEKEYAFENYENLWKKVRKGTELKDSEVLFIKQAQEEHPDFYERMQEGHRAERKKEFDKKYETLEKDFADIFE